MLKPLLRIQLIQFKNWFIGGARRKQQSSPTKSFLLALVLLYAFGALGFFAYTAFSQLAMPFHVLGLDWLYFTITAIASFALMFIGSVFFAKSQLYEAKDNDLLLSMPIKPGHILLSRMLLLYIVNLVFGLIIALPAALAWANSVGMSARLLCTYIPMFLLLALFTLAVTVLFAWLLSLITIRAKSKETVTTVMSLMFLAVYFVFMSRINSALLALISRAEELAEKLGAVAPLYWLGSALADGRADYLLYVVLIFGGAFALAYSLLSRTFIRTATANAGAAKAKYVEKRQSSVSPQVALVKREFARFSSSSVYMMNAGIGLLFFPVLVVLAIVKQDALFAMLAQLPLELDGFLIPVACLILSWLNSMIMISAPSVSLEGKNLWIAQSLPVDTRLVLRAKLLPHLILALPLNVTVSAVFAAILGANGLEALLLIAVPALFCVFFALLGLMMNLISPNLDWINITQAVKTGMSLMFTLFIGWGVVLLPLILLLIASEFISPLLIIGIFALLLLAASVLIYRWIMSRGAERFRAM